MRVIIAACFLFVAGCSIPGLDEIEQKIDGVSGRIEALEEAASQVEEIDLSQVEDLETRVAAIEGQLMASGVEVTPEAGLDITEALEAVDSLQESMEGIGEALDAQADSLGGMSSGIAALSEDMEGMAAALDSLEVRLEELEDEVSSLGSASSSGGSSGGGTSRGGSSGGGRTSGSSSGGSSGSSR